MNYESVKQVESSVCAGVVFAVARMSIARRMDLMRRVRELTSRAEFLEAGTTPGEKMDAALLQAEIDRLYVSWGIRAIAGLDLDGAPATSESLADSGPEELFREAVAAVRAECGLNAAERKN